MCTSTVKCQNLLLSKGETNQLFSFCAIHHLEIIQFAFLQIKKKIFQKDVHVDFSLLGTTLSVNHHQRNIYSQNNR